MSSRNEMRRTPRMLGAAFAGGLLFVVAVAVAGSGSGRSEETDGWLRTIARLGRRHRSPRGPGSLTLLRAHLRAARRAMTEEPWEIFERRLELGLEEADRELPGKLETAALLEELAELCPGEPHLAHREALQRRALEIRLAAGEGQDAQLAATLRGLGRTVHSRGRPREAEAYLRRSLSLAERLPSGVPEPEQRLLEMIFVLQSRAQVEAEAGRSGEALGLLVRALSLGEVSLPESEVRLAPLLDEAARLHAARGELGEAARCYRKVIARYQRFEALPHVPPPGLEGLLLPVPGLHGEPAPYPTRVLAHVALAGIMARMGDEEQANRELEVAEGLVARAPDALVEPGARVAEARADWWERRGDRAAAAALRIESRRLQRIHAASQIGPEDGFDRTQ